MSFEFTQIKSFVFDCVERALSDIHVLYTCRRGDLSLIYKDSDLRSILSRTSLDNDGRLRLLITAVLAVFQRCPLLLTVLYVSSLMLSFSVHRIPYYLYIKMAVMKPTHRRK